MTHHVDVVSLFAGVGGIDLGLRRGDARLRTVLFCEINDDAQNVLREHFPGVPIHGDVRTLDRLPPTTRVVTAGSPCCDFSSANASKVGIDGKKSSLLREVFRLLQGAEHVEHVVIENVANMLHLRNGQAMAELGRELASLGFSYAFRIVDCRAFGLRQRRRRLVCIAQRGARVPGWLLATSATPPAENKGIPKSFAGFSWVDGNRGCSFLFDVTPTIRAHDTPLYIQSQPAIIRPASGHVGILSAEDGEALQGLPVGWTACVDGRRRFARIGNSVPVSIFEWIGRHLLRSIQSLNGLQSISTPDAHSGRRVRVAVAGIGGPGQDLRRVPHVTEWPQLPQERQSSPLATRPLSDRAIRGFLNRAVKGKSGMPDWALKSLREELTRREVATSL